VPDEQDGRASIVALTDEGRQMAEAITGARQDALAQVLDDWDDDDIERLGAPLFDRLRARHAPAFVIALALLTTMCYYVP